MPRVPATRAERPRVVSLSYELFALEHAIAGAARILAQLERDCVLTDETLGPTIAARSVMYLASARLHDVGRALRGELPPASLWNESNDATNATDGSSDVLLGDSPKRNRRKR